MAGRNLFAVACVIHGNFKLFAVYQPFRLDVIAFTRSVSPFFAVNYSTYVGNCYVQLGGGNCKLAVFYIFYYIIADNFVAVTVANLIRYSVVRSAVRRYRRYGEGRKHRKLVAVYQPNLLDAVGVEIIALLILRLG